MTRFLRQALLLCFVLGLATAASAQERKLKDTDTKKLAKPMTVWVGAVSQNDSEKALEAREDLENAAISVAKKLRGEDIFSLVTDWEEVLETGRDYKTSGDLKKGKVVGWDVGDDSQVQVFVPKSYNPKKETYPFLYILGDSSDDPEALIDEVPEEVKKAAVIAVVDMQTLPEDETFKQMGMFRVIRPMGMVSEKVRVDRNRVLIVGKGSSAETASRYAALMPHLFSAVATVGAEPKAGLAADNLKLLSVKQHDDMASATQWLLEAEPRDPYRSEVEFVLTEPWAGRCFWVQAMRFDPAEATADGGEAARLKVTADRATNTITMEGRGVYQVDFFLNDLIVDLSKPIKFIRNGVPYEYEAARSLGVLLENFKTSLDSRAVFPARVRRIDLPQE